MERSGYFCLESYTLFTKRRKIQFGYSPIQLIKNFWISLWSGANKFEHLEVTRQDKLI